MKRFFEIELKIGEFGPFAELHRFVENSNSSVAILPVVCFSTVKGAKEAGKDWQGK